MVRCFRSIATFVVSMSVAVVSAAEHEASPIGNDRDAIASIAREHGMVDLYDVYVVPEQNLGPSNSMRMAYARETAMRVNPGLCKYRAMRLWNEGGGWQITRNEDARVFFATLSVEETPCPQTGYTLVSGIDDGTLVWFLTALSQFQFSEPAVKRRVCGDVPICRVPISLVTSITIDESFWPMARYRVTYYSKNWGFGLLAYFNQSVPGNELVLRAVGEAVQ
jgi:hypothetical protein